MIKYATLAVALLATPAIADDAKQGWGFQFRQDTFDKTLFPLAIMSEEGKDYVKASLFVACAKDGSLVAGYSPSGVSLVDQTKIQFRAGDETKEFTFLAVEIPHMGSYRGLGRDDSAALIDIFAKAGGEVPYRTDQKQGVFTSIGAAQTFKIVQEHCPK